MDICEFAISLTGVDFSWLEIVKGGIVTVFLSIMIWLIVFERPAFANELKEQSDRSAAVIREMLAAFRKEQAESRAASAVMHEKALATYRAEQQVGRDYFEKAITAICDREERSAARLVALLDRWTGTHEQG